MSAILRPVKLRPGFSTRFRGSLQATSKFRPLMSHHQGQRADFSVQSALRHSTPNTTHHGSCHCQAVKVMLSTRKTPSQLGARECQCGFCKIHLGSHTSDPEGQLVVKAAPGAINRYRFGTGTADFLVCRTCGVVPAITWQRPDGTQVGVVRVQALESREDILRYEKPMDVNTETWEARLARRSRTWMPTVVEEQDDGDAHEQRATTMMMMNGEKPRA